MTEIDFDLRFVYDKEEIVCEATKCEKVALWRAVLDPNCKCQRWEYCSNHRETVESRAVSWALRCQRCGKEPMFLLTWIPVRS
jgi:hypothetical protein